MSDVGADVLAEWRVVPENVVLLSVLRLAVVVGSLYIYIYIYVYVYIYVYIYKCGDRVYLGIKCSML